MGMRESCSLLNFGIGGIKPSETDILKNGIVKKETLLGHDPDLVVEGMERDITQINSIDQNTARLRIVKSHQQGKNRALACAACPD